ncbi:MAG TPA: hypothetical protein VGE11_27340 [Pseudonocardia sp.]
MAQIVSRVPRGAVTVAELLRRCPPTPEVDRDDAEPIPVGALLRREGHATGGLPRVPARQDTAGPQAETRRGRLVRRGALAAGALVAAGSTFGLFTGMHSGEQPMATGTYPGEGALDGVAADTASTPLDSGTTAPTSWMPVAFPTTLGGSTVNKLAAAAETATRAASTAHVSTAQRGVPVPAPHQSAAAGTGAAATPRDNSVVGGVGQTTKGLGDAVSSVGRSTPIGGVTSAVGGTVSAVGDTVTHVGKTVGDTVDSATKPVVKTVDSVTAPVSTTTSAVTGAAKSTAGPLTKAVSKTITGLLG